ncbi:hypothetical protein EON65_17615 [archaeon]|nr:MAG: hypothetical protein EON65_17615 [archaeon]
MIGVALTGLLGLPPTNGLIPQAPLHVISLMVKKRHQHPEGIIQSTRQNDFYVEKVFEQRWTNLFQSTLTLMAIFKPFSYVIREIPTATLYGLFLYLGLSSFEGNQFAYRVYSWFQDDSIRSNNAQHDQNDELGSLHKYVIYKYTALQAICCGIIFGITFTPAEVIFPVLIALLVVVRLVVMPRLLLKQQLEILDSDIFQHSKVEEELIHEVLEEIGDMRLVADDGVTSDIEMVDSKDDAHDSQRELIIHHPHIPTNVVTSDEEV